MDINTSTFIALDLETTGLDIERDHIISIAAIPIKDMKILMKKAFFTLIKPEIYKYDTVKYHGILLKDLSNAPSFEEIAPALLNILDGILVGHSIQFDYLFLQRYFKKLSKDFRRKYIDIAELETALAYLKCSKNHSLKLDLDTIAHSYGIKCSFRHNALSDAFIAAQIFQIQIVRNKIRTTKQLFNIIKNMRLCKASCFV
ncbi:MAG: 3'-5' exonuclease [Thermodesulforhabdaceae bacterium]